MIYTLVDQLVRAGQWENFNVSSQAMGAIEGCILKSFLLQNYVWPL